MKYFKTVTPAILYQPPFICPPNPHMISPAAQCPLIMWIVSSDGGFSMSPEGLNKLYFSYL